MNLTKIMPIISFLFLAFYGTVSNAQEYDIHSNPVRDGIWDGGSTANDLPLPVSATSCKENFSDDSGNTFSFLSRLSWGRAVIRFNNRDFYATAYNSTYVLWANLTANQLKSWENSGLPGPDASGHTSVPNYYASYFGGADYTLRLKVWQGYSNQVVKVVADFDSGCFNKRKYFSNISLQILQLAKTGKVDEFSRVTRGLTGSQLYVLQPALLNEAVKTKNMSLAKFLVEGKHFPVNGGFSSQSIAVWTEPHFGSGFLCAVFPLVTAIEQENLKMLELLLNNGAGLDLLVSGNPKYLKNDRNEVCAYPNSTRFADRHQHFPYNSEIQLKDYAKTLKKSQKIIKLIEKYEK